jgi:hypothetical protein
LQAADSARRPLDQLRASPGRRRFLDDLLVPALHAAVALAQPDGVLVLVGQDLDLDVPWVFEELFHVHGRVAERRAGFAARRLHGVEQRGFGVHDPHAAPAAAAGALMITG